MKTRIIIIFILILFTGIITAQDKDSTLSGGKITAKAIWGPGMGMMQAIHDSCDSMKYPSFGDCFLEQMKKFNAPPEAVEFTRLTNKEGFMRDFRETGIVDVAYADFPFRANENQACFLVNGKPGMIDIDNYDIISKVDLKKNKIYKLIKKNYPDVSIWPGDRSGTDYPAVRNLPGGGLQFICSYRLQDGCHACKLTGLANLGFDFNKDGKFLGVKVINILSVQDSKKVLRMENEYSDPGETINVKPGQCFTIVLQSNATTGYGWQLAKPPDEKIISNAGKVYLPPANPMPGAGGEELWSFIADNTGSTEVYFKYIRPWEKNVKPARESVFRIIVE
jgi:predicted secreted protein